MQAEKCFIEEVLVILPLQKKKEKRNTFVFWDTVRKIYFEKKFYRKAYSRNDLKLFSKTCLHSNTHKNYANISLKSWQTYAKLANFNITLITPKRLAFVITVVNIKEFHSVSYFKISNRYQISNI